MQSPDYAAICTVQEYTNIIRHLRINLTITYLHRKGDSTDDLLSASDSATIDPAYVESDGDSDGGNVAEVPDDLAPASEPPPAV